jgi:hypothetical protein
MSSHRAQLDRQVLREHPRLAAVIRSPSVSMVACAARSALTHGMPASCSIVVRKRSYLHSSLN